MAAETIGGEDSRDKQKLVEVNNKVYARKNLSKPRNHKNHPQHDSLQNLATADANNSSQHHAVASDDSSSHNRLDEIPGYGKHDNIVKIRLNSLRKIEARAIKKNLVSELDQVRKLVKRLEAQEAQFSRGNTHSQFSANEVVDKAGSLARVNSDVGSVGLPASRPFPRLSVSVVENNLGHPTLGDGIVDIHGEFSEKEKRTPKANQYYKNSDFLLGKERLISSESKKKLKSSGKKTNVGETPGGHGTDKFSSQLFKSCSNLLSKLMKHQYGWVFNTPVDVEGLKLHDYYTIVKHPMDLGTVKTRLSKKWYRSPKEFAEDVRLTFNNALLYNPEGQDAHIMAETLLNIFEELWAAIEDQYKLNRRSDVGNDYSLTTVASRKAPASASALALVRTPSAPAPFAPPPLETRTLEAVPLDPKSGETNLAPSGKTHVAKKPKAKDPDKRDMTYEEKQRLSVNLQNLPSDKLDSIVRIIKKRNPALCQQEDEIEVDIDSVDPETLWELDRFVTNYKKSLSKNKRKAEVGLQAGQEVQPNIQERSIAPSPTAEEPKTAEAVENSIPASSPVQREGQGNNMSGSSGSSSSSSDSGSSSSDSDSDSSSV